MWLRIITALVLGPVFIGLGMSLPSVWFAVLIGGIVFLGLLEWHRLSQADSAFAWVALIAMLSLMATAYHFKVLYLISVIAAAYWIFCVYDLKTNGVKYRLTNTSFVVSSVLVLVGAWAGIVHLHQLSPSGPVLCVGFIVGIWAADSTAYFVGRAIGQRKLAPKISPGKTIEGVIGGALGAMLIAWAFCYFFTDFSVVQTIVWVVISGFSALMSVVGDLYESRLKRLAGAKDSGHLLPGHGGVLDRIDGLLAAAPIFATLFVL